VITGRRLAANRSLGGEKIVLYIVWFAYSLAVVAVLVLILVFPLLPYETVFISTHKFSLLSVSPAHPTEEEGQG